MKMLLRPVLCLLCLPFPAVFAADIIRESFANLPLGALSGGYGSGSFTPGAANIYGTINHTALIADVGDGARGLTINGDYSMVLPSAGYWGTYVVSPTFDVPVNVTDLSKFVYSFTVIGNAACEFDIRFIARNAAGTNLGGLRRSFNSDGTGQPQSFSGNLAQAGWETENAGNGSPLDLAADRYLFVFQQSGYAGATGWGRDADNIITLTEISLDDSSGPPPGVRTPVFPLSGVYQTDFSGSTGAEWKLKGWQRSLIGTAAGRTTLTANLAAGAGFGEGGQIINWPFSAGNPAPFPFTLPAPPINPPVAFLGAGPADNRFAGRWLVNTGNTAAHDADATLQFRGLPTHTGISLDFLMALGLSIDGADRHPATDKAYSILINNGQGGLVESIFAGQGEADLAASDNANALFRNANATAYYRERWFDTPLTQNDRSALSWTTASAFEIKDSAPLTEIAHNASTLIIRFLHGLDGDANDEIIAIDNFSAALTGITPGINAGQWAAVHFTDDEAAALAAGAWNDDPDGDGMSNLLEYAYNEDPLLPSPPSNTSASIVRESGISYLAVSYRRPNGAQLRNDLTTSVEASSTMAANTWNIITTIPVGAAVDNGDGSETITLRDSQPAVQPGSPRRYFRMRFTLP
jgi:hypothetical protein